MADFNTRILVDVVTSAAEKAIKKLERDFDKVSQKAAKIADGISSVGAKAGSANLRAYTNTLSKLDKQLGGLGRRLVEVAKAFDFGGKTVVGIAGLNALGDALSSIPKLMGGAAGALREFGSGLQAVTSPIDQVVSGLQAIGPAGLATAGGIAAATAAVMAFSPAAKSAAKSARELRTNLDLGDISPTISEKVIRDALKSAVSEQKQLTAGTSEYTRKTEEVVALQRELTGELRRQEIVLRQVNKAQVQIAETVRKNIRDSKTTRTASGFSEFSQRAGAQTAIDKSIRRQQEKLANNVSQGVAVEFQKALPSAELLAQRLKESGQEVQRLSSYYGDLNTQIDRGSQEATEFLGRLKGAAAAGQKLPPIFGQFSKALEKIVDLTQDATAAQQKENELLQDAVELAAKNARLRAEDIQDRKDALALSGREIEFERKLLAIQERQAKAKERQRRRGQLGQDLLLGAGFPLLFGGGAGSVAGGVVGSLAGQGKGGFGAQIFGSAIGQIIDQIAQAATELGQALNPLTLDLSAVAKAAGVAGTETEALLKKVEETQGAYVAARLAADQLAVVIGQDGVDALKDLGESATNLGNEASKAFAALSAALAPALTAINNFLASSIQRSRLLSRGAGDFRDDEQIQGIRQRFQNRELGEIETENLIIQRVQQLEAAEAKVADEKLRGAAAAQQTTDAFAEQLDVLDKRNAVINSTGSLLDEATYLAERQLIFAQTRLDVAKAENDQNKVAIALAKERNALDDLRARRKKEQQRKDKKDGQGSRDAERAAQKEAQVQRNLAQLATKRFELETKFAQLGQTKADQLAIEELTMNRLFELRRAEIAASTEDDRIKQARLALLTVEEEILRRQNQLAQDRLRIEENITFLKNKQNEENLQRSLDQELAGITIPTGNRDLDEQNELRLRQAQRYENALKGINDQIKIQEERKSDPTQVKDATEQIRTLEAQRDIYKEMLPQISAAEQQQLKFNQTYAKVKPIADAVTGSLLNGIRGVIEGTKTAEQAFADFLNTIVDLLLKSAAEQIAAYIAIGLARQFAGLGNSGTGQGSAGFGESAPNLGAVTGISAVGREIGGKTMANMPYVVGEKGAELFIPGKTGTVVPADVFDATRKAVQGNEQGGDSDAFAQNAVAMGNSTTISKEKELVREMDMRNNEPIEVRYDATVINNVSYVSEDEFQKGLKAAVAQSKSAVYSDLKNKPRARAGIGLR